MADAAFFGLSSGTRDLLERVLEFKPDVSYATNRSRDLDAYEAFSGKGHLSDALQAEAEMYLRCFLLRCSGHEFSTTEKFCI